MGYIVKNTVAFIPLRAGSKSIPLKNIKTIAGLPLAAWCIKAAQACPKIDEIVISTDSSAIKETLSLYKDGKTFFYDRDPTTATDEATTESALLEYFEKNRCKNIILIQATSPLLTERDLNSALDTFFQGGHDSLFSGCYEKGFYWKKQGNDVIPVNYNPSNRPRRQDFEGQFKESGAFYIFTHENLIKNQNRLGGKIGIYPISGHTSIEVDEPTDWVLVECLLSKKRQFLLKNLENIKLVITDIDGVWTDGGMYYSESGDFLKKFHTKDGMGVELLKNQGIATAVITSEDTDFVKKRAKKLKIDYLYQGIKDKKSIVETLQKTLSISANETAYIGDDLNDLPVKPIVGYFFAPSDAVHSVRLAADFICSKRGGEGCFREMVDLIIP